MITVADFKRSRYGEYEFPWTADLLGLCIVALQIMCIPAVFIYKLCFLNKDLPFRQVNSYSFLSLLDRFNQENKLC